MNLDRRQLLAAGGASLAACSALPRTSRELDHAALDGVFHANARVAPELAGAGANHYPMGAEVLEAFGHPEAIPAAWSERAGAYGPVPAAGRPIEGAAEQRLALGDPERAGDWLACFRRALDEAPWSEVVSRWAPLLAPAATAAAFHGLIRTGHAVRALRRADTPARRDELAAGLAYWASRYVELPTSPDGLGPGNARALLPTIRSPWLADDTDVPFDGVVPRLLASPATAPVEVDRAFGGSPEGKGGTVRRDIRW